MSTCKACMAGDYIKRDDAVKIAERYGLANGSVLGRHTGLADCIASEISDLPTADVAPVVRCKYCEFSRELTKTEKRIWLDECRACESQELSQSGYMIVFPEDFCSNGKRREE